MVFRGQKKWYRKTEYYFWNSWNVIWLNCVRNENDLKSCDKKITPTHAKKFRFRKQYTLKPIVKYLKKYKYRPERPEVTTEMFET